ncbi:hypothetical protein CVIRNUC_003372 [Coccomyxa viridis]|uniref:Uncharacterized protein n=1 Tax=Coccomyxa viridis TaxID=1274662 RepID=A0AAV1HZK9_9CHLO|nr:hypothetical protein CVIRNUC_003372 [Coccomyxa viridis]
MEATSANPLQQTVVSPPDYEYIKIDAPAQDTCYCMLNILTCCMIQACLSPTIIRIKNRMANRGWDFVGDSASNVAIYRTLHFRRRRDAAWR